MVSLRLILICPIYEISAGESEYAKRRKFHVTGRTELRSAYTIPARSRRRSAVAGRQQLQRGSSRAINTALPDIGIGDGGRPNHGRRRGAPGEGRLHHAGASTVCAQGEVRGADGVPRAATPYVPLSSATTPGIATPTGIWTSIGSGPGIGGPDRVPGVPVVSDHDEQIRHEPSNHTMKEPTCCPPYAPRAAR